MTAHTSKQSGQDCYQKGKYENGELVRQAWLCHTPAHGSAMEGIVLRDNKMGQATGCRGQPFEGAFADDEGHSLEPEIDRLAEMGAVGGCSKFPEPRFCPDQNVTRGQAAAMIVKAFDIPRQGGNYFDDDDGRWFERYADALYRAGVTTGTAPRRFDGYEVATRGTVITFISRALDLPPTSRDYFTDDDGTWWEDHANRARAAGIVNGCSSTRFCGSRTATRAETAAMVVRAID
jgi:hypothetical protein